MARTPFNEAAAADMGERLAAMRAKLGDEPPSYDRIARDLEIQYGIVASTEQVRKAHIGHMDPHVAQLDLLSGLLRYYGRGPEDLGPVAYARIEHVLVNIGRGPTSPPTLKRKLRPASGEATRCSSESPHRDESPHRRGQVVSAYGATYAKRKVA